MFSCHIIELILLVGSLSCLLFISKNLHILVQQTCIGSSKNVSLFQVLLFDIKESFSIEIISFKEVKLVFFLLLNLWFLVESLQSSLPFDSECISSEQRLDFYSTFPFSRPFHSIPLYFCYFLCVNYSTQVTSYQFLDFGNFVLLSAKPLNQSFVLHLSLDNVGCYNSNGIPKLVNFFMILIK